MLYFSSQHPIHTIFRKSQNMISAWMLLISKTKIAKVVMKRLNFCFKRDMVLMSLTKNSSLYCWRQSCMTLLIGY